MDTLQIIERLRKEEFLFEVEAMVQPSSTRSPARRSQNEFEYPRLKRQSFRRWASRA